MLTTDDFNGEDILPDKSEPLDEQVVQKIMTDKLKSALPLLAEDEQKLIREIFMRIYRNEVLQKNTMFHRSQYISVRSKFLKNLKKL